MKTTSKFKLSIGTKISYLENTSDRFDTCTIIAIVFTTIHAKFNRIYFSDGGETTLENMNKALKDPECYKKIDETLSSEISEFIL